MKRGRQRAPRDRSPTARALKPEELAQRCDPASLGFETTAEVGDGDLVLGQDRAVDAIRLGMEMPGPGYNLFVLGSTGSGRNRITYQFIEERAAGETAPDDYAYINNFEDAQRPRALKLPAGTGRALCRDADKLIEELTAAIPAAFEAPQYKEARAAITAKLKGRHEKELESLQKHASQAGIAVARSPMGFSFALTRDGKVLDAEALEKLSDEEQAEAEVRMKDVHDRLHALLQKVPILEKQQRDEIRELDRETTRLTAAAAIDELRERYGELPRVVEHLDAMEQDVVENAAALLGDHGDTDDEGAGGLSRLLEQVSFRRYRIHLVVDNSDRTGAPVVRADHPTVAKLVGKIEHMSRFGALVTDFNLIQPGALHTANGGYLIVDARRLLTQPFAWEHLKRTLRAEEIRFESPAEALGLMQTVSLEPEPIPLKVKVVLIGERFVYYRMSALDPEFDELFKVAAEFADDLERDVEVNARYAALLARVVRTENLRPFDCGAVARILDHGARLAGHAGRLSLRMREIFDLLREADHFADDAKQVTAQHVQKAIDERVRRYDRIPSRIRREIREGTLHIETGDSRVGEVNGLSVLGLGRWAWGRPSRISARARQGKGDLVNIDREVELSGPIHSKGVLILNGYLGSRYLPDRPLSLHATLTFEQSYGPIDGDSASLAELLCLLSALSEVALRQGLAVTGSVDQTGRVQAVGGVNEKIEGFFDVCSDGGLNGQQGVVIPQSNTRHLMLRKDVADAVSKGRFAVYAVDDVEQALELLTGERAGVRGKGGAYPKGSVNGRVEARLQAFAKTAAPRARR